MGNIRRSSRESGAERFAGYTERRIPVYAVLFGAAVFAPLFLIALRSGPTIHGSLQVR